MDQKSRSIYKLVALSLSLSILKPTATPSKTTGKSTSTSESNSQNCQAKSRESKQPQGSHAFVVQTYFGARAEVTLHYEKEHCTSPLPITIYSTILD